MFTVDMVKIYPLADHYFNPKDKRFSSSYSGKYKIQQHQLGAKIQSNVKRSPKKGEWYLSGAIPAAYRAQNDLTSLFYIVDIVLVEIQTVAVVKEILKNYQEE